MSLRAYRKRIRTPLLVVIVPMFLVFWGIALSRRLDPWSVAAGALAAVAIALFIFVRDDPPQHVTNWRRGAEGERRTARALRSLERMGWQVEHDLQRDGRANIDHLVRGPRGIFLIETKNLAGTVRFEDGVLTARQFDDPDEVYRYRSLAQRVRGQASELSARLGHEMGRRPWVTAVVAIWGHFPQAYIEHENVTYIDGTRLAAWLDSGVA